MPGFYESDRAVAEYLLFHYGDEPLALPWSFGPREALNFPVRCISECLLADRLSPESRALDLGCAVGRSAFELARTVSRVVAIDASTAFIRAARRLQAEGRLPFSVVREGGLAEPAVARIPDGVDPGRVHFEVGDALHLRDDLGHFDVVHAANLIDRVPHPRRLLAECAARVRPGGQLILVSPYTWTEDYTPASEWLCSAERPTAEVLATLLPGFHPHRRLDLPFLIREHARKYQWSVAEATVWVRDAGPPRPGA